MKPKMKLLCSYVHGYIVKAIIISPGKICPFPTSLTANELVSERIDALDGIYLRLISGQASKQDGTQSLELREKLIKPTEPR